MIGLPTVRHKRINELKDSKGHGTDDEWEQILLSTLVEDTVLNDITVTAKVDLDVVLRFSKNIKGILVSGSGFACIRCPVSSETNS